MPSRTTLSFLLPLLFAQPLPAMATQPAQPVVEVYKTATCGCCKQWIRHLEANGFSVKAQDVANAGDYRAKFGIADEHGSCHSARVQGYAVEGHVPASDIKRMLATRPQAAGLAVPGMPMGSPGMEGAHSEPYEVLLVKKDGTTSVYKRYR